MNMRIGNGFDVHRLVEGRPLMLGGVNIPFDRGLLGHSDADVLLHAIADALLGALALGDIGKHFPDTDPAYKDADSGKLLARVLKMAADRGYRVGNVDTIVFAQAPKIAPYAEDMRKRIAGLLGIGPEQVSVKATTTEKLGTIGRGEGIASSAVILLYQ